MIHNGTITLEDVTLPSLAVTIFPADPDSFCAKMLNFAWELVEFTRTEIVMQLVFDSPECVSS